MAVLSLTACGDSDDSTTNCDANLVGTWSSDGFTGDLTIGLSDNGTFKLERPAPPPRPASVTSQIVSCCEERGIWWTSGSTLHLAISETECENGELETVNMFYTTGENVDMKPTCRST